ncbi:MAG TPA: hypothetical protein VF389_06065 [Woeseiaceae bacterium]
MFSCKTYGWWPAALLLACGPVHGASDGFVIGLGAELDSEDGRALSAALDIAAGSKTWLSVAVAHSHSDGLAGGSESRYADIEVDRMFSPVGIRVGAAYWDNADVLNSIDLTGSIYLRQDAWRLSLDLERRDFDFTANGIGLSGRLRTGKRVSFFAGGMWYDYSRDVRLQQNIDSLRFLSRSRLTLMNSLLDERWHAGMEIEFGLKSIDVGFSRWKTAVDQGQVDSISLGFLRPLGKAADIEFRLAFDDSANYGNSTVFSVFGYFFGGL